MKHIKEVSVADLCTGCGLCVSEARSPAVRMQINSDGFFRPVGLDALDALEGRRLLALCPGFHGEPVIGPCTHHNNTNNMWGKYNYVGIGHATDSQIRFSGSSGGILTAIAIYLLDTQKVSAIVVATADTQKPTQAESVLATTAQALAQAAGSKYSPSAPLILLEQVRSWPGKVAFIGKPCDITGIRLLQENDPDLKEKIPYLLSFFCAGIPSQHGTTAILKRMNVPLEQVVKFWHRGRGWPGQATAITRENSKYEMPYKDAWGGILSKRLQFRCKICIDGIGESADIVAADAWDCDESGYPLFDEQDGQSLLIARTSKGHALLQDLQRHERVNVAPASPQLINKMQPGQLRRRRALRMRLIAMRVAALETPAYRNDKLKYYARENGFVENVRTFIGAIWRILKRRLKKESGAV